MTDNEADWRSLDWKKELANSVTSLDRLAAHIALEPEEARALQAVAVHYPIQIPRYYLSLVDKTDPADPIRKMCVPGVEELVVAGDMGRTTTDPYGDDQHDKGCGVLHKYDCTVLLVTTEQCAMYCRHCFRKRLVGRAKKGSGHDFSGALRYIAGHPEVSNVILSGGDPLMLPAAALRTLLQGLAAIGHVRFVRIGSRIPVTYPLRLFDDELISALREFSGRKALYVATHYNHPREITPVSAEAVKRLRLCGITVNNQAVLLRGVNDAAHTLAELMDGLLSIGVNPYYLYQCMPVARVRHHFQIPLKQGVEIVDRARAILSGYGKRFKYILGHEIGKLEICGLIDDRLVLKQLHARSGHDEEASRIILQRIDDDAGWLTL